MLKRRLNTYLAILCITIFGAGAAMLLVKLSSAPTSFDSYNGSDPLAKISNLNLQPVKHAQ